jgi:hypothetical protein
MPYQVLQTPAYGWYDLPFIGDDVTKIGRVIDLYSDPCKPSAEIWVYGMFTAIPTLFVALTKPELIDINIKHRGGKPRKGKKYRFKVGDIFRDALVEIPVPRWVVFRIYEWGQRIGWYFLVADAVEDFGINWISMAYKYAGCATPFLVYANYQNNHVIQSSSLTPASRRFVWNLQGVSQISCTATTAQLIVDGTYRVTWTCQFSPYDVPSQSQMPFTTYAYVDGALAGQGEMSDAGGGQRYSSGSFVIKRNGLPNPSIIIAGAWLDATKFCWMTGEWAIDRVEDTELEPDP